MTRIDVKGGHVHFCARCGGILNEICDNDPERCDGEDNWYMYCERVDAVTGFTCNDEGSRCSHCGQWH